MRGSNETQEESMGEEISIKIWIEVRVIEKKS